MSAIMFIDDDTEVLEINKKYFHNQGYDVYATSNPAKAIEFVKKTPMDCILLDIMMPGLNGIEVCRRIREFSSLPIIFLSGKSGEDDKIEGLLSLEAGINYLDAERNYDLALVACFDNKEHAAAYVNHPVHLPVKKFMHEIRSGSVAIDYEF